MSKTIVTHINPDLDAITAIWLLIRFGGADFASAKYEFVPAGERLADEDNNTVHVDTGLGKFDHHQEDVGQKFTCASKLVFEWLVEKRKLKDEDAISRVVAQVNAIDHFHECFWPEPTHDRYQFFLDQVLHGLKLGSYLKDKEIVEFGMRCLDGVFVSMKLHIAAEDAYEKGIRFESKWGKGLGLRSSHAGSGKYAMKLGYRVVIRKDDEIGAVRIKAAPYDEIDLTPVYKKVLKMDPKATWYFHPSKHILINGSMKNPNMRPTSLSLEEVIEIVKGTK